jgi:hypothetical protein
MLYIVSQDKTHYSSSAVTLKGNEIYQDGIAIATYNDEKEAIEVFENIINAHQQQIFKEPMHDPKDCIYYMREANKVKVVEKKQEVKEVVEKPTQEKKTQTKKVAK